MLFFSLNKLLLQFSKHQCRKLSLNKDRLKLHTAAIFIKKDTVCFPENVEKHLTPISQSSWMNNLVLQYSEAAVYRFSLK